MRREIRTRWASRRIARLRWALLACIAATALGVFVPSAVAVHDASFGLFELDRNAQAEPSPGDDWSTLYNSGANNGCSSPCLQFTGILPDIGATEVFPGVFGTQFQGGGSKDDLDITSWLWKAGEPLDKDDITNAYSAAYTYNGAQVCSPAPPAPGIDPCTDPGDLIVYYGLDRFSANGSAQVGFWFLQDPAFGLTNIPSGGGFTFSGQHVNNDVLVQSNFSQGGVIDTITVYRWFNGALQQLFSAADCVGPPASAANDPACATVIRSDTAIRSSPWPYTPKANEGPPGSFLTGAFFEGGLNISRLVPNAGCFSNIIAETRTSTPFDARLKDFVRGSFQLCGAKISISPSGVNRVNTNHNFTVHVDKKDQSTGFVFGNASGVTVTGSITSGPGSFVGGNTCTTGANGNCTLTITSAVTGLTTVSASSSVPLSGDGTATVSTNGQGGSSGPATKRWVDAKIGISPNGVNRVGTAHTFTATVMEDAGDGSGFVAAAGETVTGSIVNSAGATASFVGGSTCTTNASGQCTLTVNSPTTGLATVSASSAVGVQGITVNVSTDGIGFNSGPATKRWVDAKIAIGDNGVNRVGTAHTFTVTVMEDAGTGAGFVAAAGESVSGTIVNSAGATASFVGPGTCTTNASGQCTLTVNSPTTGLATVSASSGVSVQGITVNVSTDGTGLNSGPATKRWVDAKISISPNGVNRVGTPHTFTVTVMEDAGTGAGFVPALNETVTGSIVNSAGATASFVGGNTCTTNASGQCTLTVNSPTTGLATVSASSGVSVQGITVNVSTDGTGLNSGPATKRWVDAKIAIAANGVNEVGTAHTFTVTVMEDAGAGAGFVAAAGETVTGSIANSLGATASFVGGNTCTTNLSGQCTLTVNSSTTGLATVSASSAVGVQGITINVSTDGVSPNSGPATKRWVNAKIAIAANDTNSIGEPHTFTVTVMKDAGDGNGFVAATVGHVSFTLTNGGGASAVLNAAATTCDEAGDNLDGSGQCVIVFTSNSAGTVTGHASVTLDVGGVSLTRETNGLSGNSGDAVKTFIDGSLRWEKRNKTTNALLGGATFEFCRTHTLDSSGPTYVDTPDVCVSVTDNSAPDADPDAGEFLIEDLVLGRYTVRETAAPPGFTIDNPNAVTAPDMTIANPNVAISTPFLDSLPGQGCTPGFWKAHTEPWDEPTDPLVVKIFNAITSLDSTYSFNPNLGMTDQLFMNIFGLNSSQMTAAGLDPNLTMLQAIALGGGGFQKLARHGAAGLLASASVNYPFTTTQVLTKVHDAIVNLQAEPTAQQLADANNLDHSACPTS